MQREFICVLIVSGDEFEGFVIPAVGLPLTEWVEPNRIVFELVGSMSYNFPGNRIPDNSFREPRHIRPMCHNGKKLL